MYDQFVAKDGRRGVDWTEVAVCIVQDGIGNANESVLAASTVHGFFSPVVLQSTVLGAPATLHLFEYTARCVRAPARRGAGRERGRGRRGAGRGRRQQAFSHGALPASYTEGLSVRISVCLGVTPTTPTTRRHAHGGRLLGGHAVHAV